MSAGSKLYFVPLFGNIVYSKIHDMERSALGAHVPDFRGAKFLFQEGRTAPRAVVRRASPSLIANAF